MNQEHDQDKDETMISSQSSISQVDLDKIYEFNDDEFDDELYNSGFQLNRSNKIQDNSCIRMMRSNESNYYSANESIDDESMDDESNDEWNNATESNVCLNANQIPSYANLNDYVLFDIFKLLSLIELQQCRIVCKRWRSLIDTIRIKKLSLTYFIHKHSWTSNKNFENLQQYSDSVDISRLSSFSMILLKPQFRDLEHLSLVTEYATNTIESTKSSEIFELDVSKFQKLKKLELFGSFIQLNENQECSTLTHLSIEHITVDPIKLFPNLMYLKTNVYNSTTTNSKLEQLDYFPLRRDADFDQKLLHPLMPNLRVLSCRFVDALVLICSIEKPEDFRFLKLTKIKVHFNGLPIDDIPLDHLVQVAKNLRIKLEFHVNIAKSNNKGDLIRWNKLFISKNITTVYYGDKEVNLRDLILLPNYENNTLLKQSLKVDQQSLRDINDKIYKYLFHTNSLELQADGMEAEFNELLKTIPCITKLTINYRLSQRTFDRFKFNCPFLSHLKIISKQAYKLDLNFIHGLDHLTSIDLTNIDLVNCSTIQNKIKFSKFLHIIKFKNCRLLDYYRITRAMVEKAKKNTGKFYEIHILPIQQVHIASFNEQFFANAPENFYSNLFRFQS